MKLRWRFQQALLSAGPWVTFAATLCLAAWIHLDGGTRTRITGFAEGPTSTVAATEVGRIASLAVEPGQEVLAGQIVATLDPSSLDAEIALVEAEKARLEALIPATQAGELSRLDDSVEQIERELARQEEEYVRAKAEAQALEGERSRAKKLVDENLAVGDELAKIDVKYASVKPLVQEKPRRIELLRKQLASAKKRREGAMAAGEAASAGPLGGDLLVSTRQLSLLRQQRAELVLRAPVSGRVVLVNRRGGEVVAAGEPIVSLVSKPGRVVACVPEKQALRVGVGDRAKVWVRDAGGAALKGTTVQVGPIVTELPLRCRRVPTVPAWGREITIALDQPAELVAGQAFDVEIDRTSAPLAPTAAVAAADTAAGGPAPMKIPEETRKASRIEPSGILWRPDLLRYVVVSDDTDPEGKDDHPPILFALSSSGVMDRDPLPITGVDAISDLESIAQGAGGEVYVLSSQSYSRKGKRPASRTLFLKLVPEARGFRAEAKANLVEMIEAAGPDVAARLGLPDGTRELEIEGMACHRGSLYLGLKSPLDAQGNALIWKLRDPEALFSAKTLDAGGLSPWARARLDADVDGKTVPGGVSELLFLPDGSLLIASTSSKVEGTTESGRLWHAQVPGSGTLAPRVIRTFPGLKPEGLALASTPGRLVVAFDAGSAAPLWLEMPWPQ